MRSTASASVSVTVLSLTATGFVSARPAASPFTVTVKSVAAGTELSSSATLKVTVSVEPLTAAEENAGALATGSLVKSAAMLASGSWIFLTLPPAWDWS